MTKICIKIIVVGKLTLSRTFWHFLFYNKRSFSCKKGSQKSKKFKKIMKYELQFSEFWAFARTWCSCEHHWHVRANMGSGEHAHWNFTAARKLTCHVRANIPKFFCIRANMQKFQKIAIHGTCMCMCKYQNPRNKNVCHIFHFNHRSQIFIKNVILCHRSSYLTSTW